MMNKDAKNALDLARYTKLAGNPKDIKCPGALRKLRRKLRKAGVI